MALNSKHLLMNTFKAIAVILSAFLFSFFSCTPNKDKESKTETSKISLKMEDIFAWCIVPYDSMERTPEERIAMLKELGITRYAYDWRTRHLPDMAHELELAKENNIDVIAVWVWIDANYDQPGKLSDDNEKVFQTINNAGLNTQIWVGFHNNNFEGKNEAEKLNRGVEMIKYINKKAQESGSRMALYNHGGWSGEPENQVKIIKAIPDADIGIIYNFHHGHEHIDRFKEVIQTVKPYLWAVNLNGMKKDGPKILPIGKGNKEGEMFSLVIDSGFNGPFGVLGHVEDADVKQVLRRNIEGLMEMVEEVNGERQ